MFSPSRARYMRRKARAATRLLKQGAKLVETAQDILEELGGAIEIPASASVPEDAGHALLEHLGYDPVDVDTLSLRSGLTIAELSAMLLALELSGHICALPGGLYQRIH